MIGYWVLNNINTFNNLVQEISTNSKFKEINNKDKIKFIIEYFYEKLINVKDNKFDLSVSKDLNSWNNIINYDVHIADRFLEATNIEFYER